MWNVCPFGIKPAPNAFQRRLEELLQTVICKGHVLIYLDDIIIFTDSTDLHLQTIFEVFDALRGAGVCISVKKSIFMRPSVKFLGHIVDEARIQIDPDRISALSSLQHPQNKADLLTFLGAIQFLSPFIRHLADYTDAFADLRKKNAA